MKEQIVSFKVAKMAKEKGFNELCSKYYCHKYGKSEYFRKEHGKLKEFETKDEYGDKIGVYFRKKSTGQPHIIIAPTQSLLQKWLRDKHKLYVTIDCCVYGDPERYAAYLSGYGKKGLFANPIVDGFTIYDNYEKALEEGLEEALKLI